jgi:flagellar motor switch protein FliM
MFGTSAGAVDRMPTFRAKLASIGEALFEQMKPMMSAPPRISLMDCRTLTAEDAFALHPGPSCIGVFHTSGWSGMVYMTCDMNAAFVALEMLMGSAPGEKPFMADRPLTNIERRVAAVFFKTVLGAISNAFMLVAETSFELATLWVEPDYDEIKPRTVMNVARFRVETSTRKGEIHFLVPDESLASVREAMSASPRREEQNYDQTWEERIKAEFNRSKVALTAILDEREGTLDEIARLRVGDVLELNATTESLVVVETNGERLMYCTLGKSGNAYMLRVEDFVNKEQEMMDNILSG